MPESRVCFEAYDLTKDLTNVRNFLRARLTYRRDTQRCCRLAPPRKHVRNSGWTVRCLDALVERKHVPPVAVLREQGGKCNPVICRHGGIESRTPQVEHLERLLHGASLTLSSSR